MPNRSVIHPCFRDLLVVIKGAGDLASGVAWRLKRAGFPLIMTELARPSFVRRTVCFGEAVYVGQAQVEEMAARRVESYAEAQQLAHSAVIPICVDAKAEVVQALRPATVVDAIIAKRNIGTTIAEAPLVVALGPGFTAGVDCHVVIETKRGHRLGRTIEHGQAEADTRIPDLVHGYGAERVLRAPAAGYVEPLAAIGDRLAPGQVVAKVSGQAVAAPFAGVLRGLIHATSPVTPGMKIGDVDPRGVVEYCYRISDKALAIGGGVLEAILASEAMRQRC
jgi:xanthine dehydrogenase accessory factor